MPEHTYHDTVIGLSNAVTNYGLFVKAQNANNTPVYTNDSVTWHIDAGIALLARRFWNLRAETFH